MDLGVDRVGDLLRREVPHHHDGNVTPMRRSAATSSAVWTPSISTPEETHTPATCSRPCP